MLKRVINAVVGSRHERERRRIQPIVDRINAITARRVQDVAEQIFTQGVPTLAGIGPIGNLADVGAIGDYLKR